MKLLPVEVGPGDANNEAVMATYVQCLLATKPNGKTNLGTRQITTWIPKRFAVLGKELQLQRDDGSWDRGWTVMHAGAEMEEDKLPDAHAMVKAHRQNTGDSQPKESSKR